MLEQLNETYFSANGMILGVGQAISVLNGIWRSDPREGGNFLKTF